MSLERGIFYMNQIGLTGITREAVESMGLAWKSIASHREMEKIMIEMEKAEILNQVALKERTGLDEHLLEDHYYAGYWEAEDLELDRPFDVDQKKFHKSGKLYSRRSHRSNGEWFETHPK
ncbi:hypothetical protein BGZ65_008517 [Modicella reniformis]|uniref:Uncharacterized protein n=1 Tax=Modicella reniformis TaxID=1440133 RepID=A0A9P6SPI1_9FUNG|nr:hypothetical protein BGZ65_008517 [Modicella reniformis]